MVNFIDSHFSFLAFDYVCLLLLLLLLLLVAPPAAA